MDSQSSNPPKARLSVQLLTALIPVILLSVGIVSLIAMAQLSVVASGRQVLTFGLLAATVLVISLGFIVSMTLRFSRRLQIVGEAARRAAQGEPVAAGSDIAELGDLIKTIQQLSNQLAETTQDVERRVRDRTRDLAITSEIGRIATSLRDIDVLLSQTVEHIRTRFDVIYHAQIFLLDDAREYAVLVASTGEAGQMLLTAGHRLQVGSESVIGRVTARNQTVIASDTRKGDVPWRQNPLLPDTRAEMAVPLAIEDQVIGALDVQSIYLDVFTPEMIQVFKVLGDQLAIAIENARLLSESEKRVREIDILNRQLTRSAWGEFLEARPGQTGYLYDWRKVRPLDGSKDSMVIPGQSEFPIQVRGETIGTLVAALDQGMDISADDQVLIEAVAQRVALAIENARLFEQTQRALAETERLYETSRAVTSTPALEDIYGLVVEQLNTVSYVDRIELLLSGPDPILVQYLESVYIWNREDQVEPLHERVRIFPQDPLEEPLFPIDRALMVANINRELPASHPLAARLKAYQANSAVLVPLDAGGRWFGMLVCSSQRIGAFDTAYMNFASALSDQLAITIENRRLFDEAQSEARRARALAEAGQLASQIGGDYETGLHNLFQTVAGPGHYDRWWFGLLTDNNTVLRRVTTSHNDLPDVLQVQEDRNALAEAARIEEIVLVNDPADHPIAADMSADEVALWGKYITMPVKIGAVLVGVLMVGRSPHEPDLDERDIQLAATLTSQVAVATENRRLFEQAESERQNLQTIVDTMPTGILVINASGEVMLSNQNLQSLLGLKPGQSENLVPYPIVRADSRQPYPREEWPVRQVFETGTSAFVDDMVILSPSGKEISVLAHAAPIHDSNGRVTAVVGAFQDITELQELERALQGSLRETTLLYEASRSISGAAGMDELLQMTLKQVNTVVPDQIAIFLNADETSQEATALVACQPKELVPDYQNLLVGPLFGSQPQIVSSANTSAEMANYLKAANLTMLASFPLNVRNHTNGWIWIGFCNGQTLSTEQRRFMVTLADQVAINVENQQLLRRTAQALQDTAALYQASRAIAGAQTPHDILLAFVKHAVPQSSEACHAALYLLLGEDWDTPYAAVEVAATWGKSPTGNLSGKRYPVSQFPFLNELRADEVLFFDDIRDHPRLNEYAHRIFDMLTVCSAVFIPLRMGDRYLGAILLGMGTPRQSVSNETRIYQSLADQAAVSLENNRLYQQAQLRARQLGTAAEISRAVTSILQLDLLLPQVVNQIHDAFGYDHVQIFLLNEDATQANLVASTGEAGQKLLEIRHSLPVGSRSVIGQVTLTGYPQVALDTADAKVIHKPNPYLPNTRSEMALPLIARGQIVGALDVQSNQSGAFTDEDTRMLASLADLVATAIDNARLFELSEQRAEEMAFLFNVTTAAASSSDMESSLRQTVETLRSTLDVTHASIYLTDESGQSIFKGASVGLETGDSRTTEFAPVSLDLGLVGWVALNNEAAVVQDVSADPRCRQTGGDIRSSMAVPLRTAGILAGVLLVESTQLGSFDEHDLRLLQTLSGSLAAIIQNSQLLREVQEANERLLEVDRLKTNFLAAMSHELRTPLNSIIGFSRVILKGIDGPVTETQEQDLNTIYESGKHLLGLVNDILDQAKIEAGKMDLSFAYFKLPDVIHGVMSTAVGLTRDKHIRLYTELADNLPDAYGDEFRTRQILLNLVSNASKFTQQGSITVSAFPVHENDQTFIQVSVSDTGIGIAEKDMNLLFEPFQQLDNSTTRAHEGTGMGLPLAKSLTEMQGGRIWVNSTINAGSTFSVTVPTAPPPVREEEESEEKPISKPITVPLENVPNFATEAALPNRIVLVVEDDVEVINLYRRYLARDGYEVMGTIHPEDVEELVIAYHPCVVLLDVNMPTRDGWDVLQHLKDSDKTFHTPVILCSIQDDTERGFHMGAADYLVKPFTEEQLLNAVRRIEGEYKRQHILIVDDKPESIRVFRETLEATQQYLILEATTGQQAIDLMWQDPRIELVILDLRMPGIDGFSVLQTMRTQERMATIPVLVLTAEDVNSDERAALEPLDVYRKDRMDEHQLLQQVETRLRTGQN